MAKNLIVAALILVSSLASISAAELEASAQAKPTFVVKEYHVAVEGTIYCKSCKLPGYNKGLDASPIKGAVAKLQCYLKPYSPPYEVTAKTDAKGYFLILASEKLSSNDYKKCKVFLVSSPLAFCNKPTDFGGGVSGAPLVYEKNVQIRKSVYSLYSAGVLEFAPKTPYSCPKIY